MEAAHPPETRLSWGRQLREGGPATSARRASSVKQGARRAANAQQLLCSVPGQGQKLQVRSFSTIAGRPNLPSIVQRQGDWHGNSTLC